MILFFINSIKSSVIISSTRLLFSDNFFADPFVIFVWYIYFFLIWYDFILNLTSHRKALEHSSQLWQIFPKICIFQFTLNRLIFVDLSPFCCQIHIFNVYGAIYSMTLANSISYIMSKYHKRLYQRVWHSYRSYCYVQYQGKEALLAIYKGWVYLNFGS